LETNACATVASVGRPPSMRRAGAGDWTTTSSQARQAYLGRRTDEHPELRGNDVELLAHVLADPVQGPLAARAGLVLDVDERLEARRMRRQGAAVRASFARAVRARGSRPGFRLRGRLRLALLGILERQQQLVFRQALGAAAEAVTLQVLDDLSEPFGALTLGDQHRLQRFRIVGERLDRLRHGSTTS
jgi:hypothetical protein